MIKCNTLTVKLSNSQLNKSKPAIWNSSEVTLNVLSNVILILMMKLIFYTITISMLLLLTDTQLLEFLQLLQIVHHPVSNFQKINCLRWCS